VWAFFGRREVDGEPPPAVDPHATSAPVHVPVPEGWRVSESGRWSFLSAETGERRALPEVPHPDWTTWQTIPIGPFTSLVHGETRSPDGRWTPSPWLVHEHDALASRPAGLAPGDAVLRPLLDGRVLVSPGDGGPPFLYDARAERRTAVRAAPDLPGRILGAWGGAPLPGGKVLLQAAYAHPDRWRVRGPWLGFDPAVPSLETVDLPIDAVLVAALEDGAVVLLEDERRVVRHGPRPGERTVLWPRGTRP
jgi:hypothetical protein